MRGRIIVVMFLLVHRSSVFGQSGKSSEGITERVRMKYELSAGALVSKMQSDDKSFEKIMEAKPGLIIQGGVLQYLAPRLDLNLSIGFANKGNIIRAISDDASSSPPRRIESIDEETLNYLNLHLMPRIYVDKESRLGISFGPYLGIVLSDKLHSEQYIDDVLTTSHTAHNILGYEKFDIGFSSELHYQLDIFKHPKAILKLKWDRGLFNIGPGSAAIFNQIFSLQGGTVF